MNAYFCQGEIDDPCYYRIFSSYIMMKIHSNQGHDNAINHPPFPESIEPLTEQIIHYVPVQRL